ncbi:hypothetical protein mvi_48040 [Methylobacterium indicum]|uniref:Uncharacterized protein n=1 Tax=Methylobacterium indicum TaxID=1775910 RepID=A0A8H9C8R1_9HYPH|nr:hypothetical protein mvi_48040 [Methylobacterium indicum]
MAIRLPRRPALPSRLLSKPRASLCGSIPAETLPQAAPPPARDRKNPAARHARSRILTNEVPQ